MKGRIAIALAALALLTPLAAGPATGRAQAPAIDPADFQATIDNPLFPLSSLGPKLFLGEERDPDTDEVAETRLESRVLPQTTTVAGVTVTVLEEKAYVDGELVEVALDYFAQHRDGSVYYFGERVDNYEDGVLKDHEGQWLAGEGENQPGIIMQAHPQAGQTYSQESAPGIAEDKATVVSVNESITVPTGSYTGCLKTKDFSPLEPGVEEFKHYCPGVGLVREEGANEFLELVEISPAPAPSPTPAQTPSTQGVVAPRTGDGSGQSTEGPGAGLWWLAAAGGASLLALGAGLRRRRRSFD